MERITLNNGSEVSLMLTHKRIIEFEKTHTGSNLIKTLYTNNGAPDYKTVCEILYVGYLGGGNKEIEVDEFIELLPMNIDVILTKFNALIRSQKKQNSRKP